MKLSQLSMQNENIGELESQKYLSFHRFLTNFGIDSYKINSLKADCSLRRYYRILSDIGSHILMDSSQDPTLDAYIYVTSLLKRLNLRIPNILMSDLEAGYLLVEDFGNNLLTKFLKDNPHHEKTLYELCTKVLIQLAQAQTAEMKLPSYDGELLNKELEIFCQWYLKYNIDPKKYTKAHSQLLDIFNNLYPKLEILPQVLILRDFMADNIMIIENGTQLGKIGIIDFQDAVIGCCTYDIVSLLEDARRDVTPLVKNNCIMQFYKTLKISKSKFYNAYTILGLQRNLKIIGVFHRMNIKNNNPQYLNYLPRVWQYIFNALEKDVALSLKQWFIEHGLQTHK